MASRARVSSHSTPKAKCRRKPRRSRWRRRARSRRCSRARRTTCTRRACSACGVSPIDRRPEGRGRGSARCGARVLPKQVDERYWYGFCISATTSTATTARSTCGITITAGTRGTTRVGHAAWVWYSYLRTGTRIFSHGRGAHAQHQRDVRLSPRPDGRTWLAAQRRQMGRRPRRKRASARPRIGDRFII